MKIVGPVVLAMVAGVLVACSNSAEEARAQVRAACTVPAPDAPGYDPQQAGLALLEQLAQTARTRADIAEQAALLDERWAVLSEASNLLAAAADRVLEVRRSGGVVAEEMPPAVWDQIKYASDAFLLECRTVLE